MHVFYFPVHFMSFCLQLPHLIRVPIISAHALNANVASHSTHEHIWDGRIQLGKMHTNHMHLCDFVM